MKVTAETGDPEFLWVLNKIIIIIIMSIKYITRNSIFSVEKSKATKRYFKSYISIFKSFKQILKCID